MQSSLIYILHLEDNEIDADIVTALLKEEGLICEIHRAIDRLEFLGRLENRPYDLIISDYSMPSFDGKEALRLARQFAPDTPFMYVSGTIGEDTAVESLKNGAVDYVLKGRLSRFPAAVRRAIEESRQRSERAKFQRELIRREELFRQITDNVDDLIAVLDLEGRRVFSSPSYTSLLGDLGQLGGTDSFADIDAADRDRVREVFEETVRTGVGRRITYGLRRKDGSLREIESQGSVVKDASGKVVNVVVVSRDVTDARQMEARLREQAELLDKAQDAIFVRNLNRQVTYWNHGAERLYGWTREEVQGRRVSEIINGREALVQDPAWNSVLKKGEWTGELKLVTKDRRELTVVSRWTLLRDPAGLPIAVMSIDSDITEKKEMEERLLRGQRLESIGSLAGGIAHDLNNILSPILMLTDFMCDEADSDSERSMLQTVKTSAMRGAGLVRQILSFAHGISEKPMNIQVRHVIKDMVNLMQDTFPRSINIKQNVARDLWPVHGDPTRLHQVILNLCVNARDAMPHGGELIISARNIDSVDGNFKGRGIVIEVSDTGTGIPLEIRDKIFQPYYSTKGPDKGTGLGLSTVGEIVKQHGGNIRFTSQLGGGTTFLIELPADIGDNSPSDQVAGGTSSTPKGKGERILLVDDEQAVLTMSKGLLEAFNYRVTVARDGLEALSIHREQRGAFDMVITDTMMPGMDGPALIRYLKRSDPELKVIAISGLADSSSLLAAPENLAGRLQKPYEGQELLSLVSSVLSPGAQ